MTKTIARRMAKIDASGIRKVFALAEKIKNPINLSIGQPDFDTPEKIKKEAIAAINQGFNKYTPTQGILALREAIVQKLQRENDIKLKADNVLVTAGTSGGLTLAFLTLLDEKDEVIIPDPYFVIYKHLVNFVGARPKLISTYPDFQIDPKKIEKAITSKTKMIILNSPNNPTGAVYSQKTIEAIIEIAKSKNIFLLSDEIYEKFIYEKNHFSPGSVYKNTITLNGFSKFCSVPGWRIGYAAGPKEIINEMAKLQQYTFVCAPSFAQKAAISALKYNPQKHIKKYQKRRDFLYEELKPYFKIQKPDGSFYLFPEAPSKNGTNFVKRAINNRLLIIPGKVFSEKDTHFRISYTASEEEIKKGIAVLKDMIELGEANGNK